MEHLPQLDITEDLELLAQDDDLDVSIVSEDLSEPIGPSRPQDIFVGKPTNNSIQRTPKQIETQKEEIIVKKGSVKMVDDEEEFTKVKKPLSDKQKAHLAKIRVKALESKREKARLKKEVKERVELEVREKRGKKKKVQIVEKDEEIKQVAEPINKTVSKNLDPDYNFNNFMSHMEKYQKMQYDYQMKQLDITKKNQEEQLRKEEEKREAEKIKLNSQMAQLKYQQARLNDTKLPTPKLPTTIQPQKPKNPYDDLFSW